MATVLAGIGGDVASVGVGAGDQGGTVVAKRLTGIVEAGGQRGKRSTEAGQQAFGLIAVERGPRRQAQGSLEHARAPVLPLPHPAQQTDPASRLQPEPVETIFGHLRGDAPGELRLAGHGKRVDEEFDIAIQQIGQHQQFIRLDGTGGVPDVDMNINKMLTTH